MKLTTVVLVTAAASLARAQQPYPPQPYPYYPPQPQPYPYYPPVAPRPARLLLTTLSEAAAVDVWACADALEAGHGDVARQKCGDALAKDPQLALAHFFFAQAAPPEQAHAELERAVALAARVTPAERLTIDAHRALQEGRAADARALFDRLVATVPGEARVLLWRGRLRRSAGDLDGPIADFKRATELSPRYALAQGELALALAERGELDAAQAAAARYLALAPAEANAQLVSARLALRRDDTAEAAAAARRALALDAGFVAAHAVFGDALVLSGHPKDARKEYGVLIAVDDPATHHQGAMREARSYLYEGRNGDAERALGAEADLAQKTRRPGDQIEALTELARVQLDRGGVAEAGQTLRQATAALKELPEPERRPLAEEHLALRAMILAAVGERALAEARVDELAAALKQRADVSGPPRVAALKGWIAARNGDDQAALLQLAGATRPTLRMALALAAARAGDPPRARAIMEELAHRAILDLDGALTRPRALAWLKQQSAAAPATR